MLMRPIDELKSEGGAFTELDRISQKALSAILIDNFTKRLGFHSGPKNCHCTASKFNILRTRTTLWE